MYSKENITKGLTQTSKNNGKNKNNNGCCSILITAHYA
jgi:hypothetical protein